MSGLMKMWVRWKFRSSSLMVWHYLDPNALQVRYTVLGRPEFPVLHREFLGVQNPDCKLGDKMMQDSKETWWIMMICLPLINGNSRLGSLVEKEWFLDGRWSTFTAWSNLSCTIFLCCAALLGFYGSNPPKTLCLVPCTENVLTLAILCKCEGGFFHVFLVRRWLALWPSYWTSFVFRFLQVKPKRAKVNQVLWELAFPLAFFVILACWSVQRFKGPWWTLPISLCLLGTSSWALCWFLKSSRCVGASRNQKKCILMLQFLT